MITITLEQARSLDALARHGTFVAAANALHKQHTAVVYAIKNLETQTELVLLDRSSYRVKLTAAGTRVLTECQRLLAVERDIDTVCATIRSGWEPSLRIVFDGVVPAQAVLAPVKALMREAAPTRIEVVGEFLSRVEEQFRSTDADLMVSVLPPNGADLVGIALPLLQILLVAHKAHALGRMSKVDAKVLARHALITVRGSDPRLQLPTNQFANTNTVQLHDFQSKKHAIMEGLGFGWMPEPLVAAELKRGTLRMVEWKRHNTHVLRPHVYHRRDRELGRAAKLFVQSLISPE